MLLFVAWTFGLVLWIVLWALDVKALDAFMLVVLIMLTAVTVWLIRPMLPGNRREGSGPRHPGGV